jgi:hypothetical protein
MVRAVRVPPAWPAVALAAFAGFAAADDLPSPDAMALGQRVVPRALLDGFRSGIEDQVLDQLLGPTLPSAEQPPLRTRARAAMAPLLDEAFPPEVLVGMGAQFLARHYTADELHTLRAREESPLGRKLRAFEESAAAIMAPALSERDQARDQLARRTFTDAERKDLESFAASPLGRKGLALAPDLVAYFVDRLDRRYASIRSDLDPRLRRAVEAVLPKAPPQ